MKTRRIAALLAAVLLTGTAGASTLVRRDFDGDGLKEATVLYTDGVIQKAFVDADHDNFAESVIHYRQGYRDTAVKDTDKDGRADTWVWYEFTGVPWKIAEDYDRDGRADYWAYFKQGALYRWEQDRNGDGTADLITVFETFDHAGTKGQRFLRQWHDDDFDGIMEALSAGSTYPKTTSPGAPPAFAELVR